MNMAEFDHKYYLEMHPDLVTKNIITEKQAYDHYLNYGKLENRLINEKQIECHESVIYKLKNSSPCEFLNYQTKISIVMTCVNRKTQLVETLKSFSQYLIKYNFEVIIVDDGSDISVENIKETFFEFDIKVITIPKKDKKGLNGTIAYNIGFQHATGDIIVIQNAEIIHIGNVLENVLKYVYDDNYVVFSVFNSPNYEYNDLLYEKLNAKDCNIYNDFLEKIDYNRFDFQYDFYVKKYDISKRMDYTKALKHWYNVGMNEYRQCNESDTWYEKKMIKKWKGWLSHPEYNPRCFHFLSAVKRENLLKMGGFDETLCNNKTGDDDDFIIRMANVVNNITILGPELCFGIHQYHADLMQKYEKLFDWKKYTKLTHLTIDLKKNMINNHDKSWSHFLQYGYKEERENPFSDEETLDKCIKFLKIRNGEYDFYKNTLVKKVNHIEAKVVTNQEEPLLPNEEQLLVTNQEDFYVKKSTFNYPKIMHLYWDGSPLSFLNYMTVLSFNKYNKDWEIHLYMPSIKIEHISWTTNEQKIKYTGLCYLNKLLQIPNVKRFFIDLDEIGFYNDASEVVKSDYFRYYILQKYGGLWGDFDIIYTAGIEEKMNFKEDTVIFRCNIGDFYYYPIGMFMCKPNNTFFMNILNKCKEYYDKRFYQSIGVDMWNKLFPNTKDKLYEFDNSVKVCDYTYYLPWNCDEIKEFLSNKDNRLPLSNVGIHWFNGSCISKNYLIELQERINKNNFKIEVYLDRFVAEYANEFMIEREDVKKLLLFSESSYPGGGGEEFLMDIAIYFKKKKYNIYWITLHDWGKPIYENKTIIEKEYYREVQLPFHINDINNFHNLKTIVNEIKPDYIFSQGAGHKLICDIGNEFNIPTITEWCFWEEAINIDWKYGVIDINKNLDKHNKCNDFKYIVDNIDHFYFASVFVKDTIERKYNMTFSNDNVLPTLSNGTRFLKDNNIDSYNSQYITLLDAHTLKGGKIMADLIKLNPNLSFLTIKTECEEDGPNSIKKAMDEVNNSSNILYYERVNNVSEIYNKTKILLCPTYLDETFCRVVFESFQNKIPVIFSDKGNLNTINNTSLLKLKLDDITLWNNTIHKLINDREYYDFIVNEQYKYYLKLKTLSDLKRIEDKFIEIENRKNKNIGIFTPWCDQGLGIQSRVYKHILTKLGFNVFIFSTKPYINTTEANLIKNKEEWDTNNIYRSPNKRLDINNLELDLFVRNYKIKKLIIPEIQYSRIFDIASYLKDKYDIKTYAIPNIECIQNRELPQFDVFEKVLVNNRMSYNMLKKYNVKNLHYLGFHYDITDKLKINEINLHKYVSNVIKIIHLTGLNGLIRKRTIDIINIFDKIYANGITNFELTIVIQGNFEKTILSSLNKPFLKIINQHLSYVEILNLYNEHHISIQISKHEGLGLGFYESCFMNTPVITLNAPPHNEIIDNNKNGWLLSCTLKKDKNPENPFTIIEQTQIVNEVAQKEIEVILKDINNINNVIQNTKNYLNKIHGYYNFKNNLIKYLM